MGWNPVGESPMDRPDQHRIAPGCTGGPPLERGTDGASFPAVTDPSERSRPESRRRFLDRAVQALAAVAGLPVLADRAAALQAQAAREVTVYKDPNCGCCTAWAKHVRAAGFTVTERETDDLGSVKAAMGVPRALESCHTARIGGYVVEGHVPADLIAKLLRERPEGRGLAVPGMPIGSPGMEGGRPERYDILLFDKAGRTRVYATRG